MPKLIKYIILLFITLLLLLLSAGFQYLIGYLESVNYGYLKVQYCHCLYQKITGKGIVVADIKVTLGNCEWIKVNQLTASTRAKWPTKWIIHTQSLVSDNNCLSQLKDNQTAPAEIDIKQILTAIPALELTIEQFVLQPWPF